jgi:6-phosphogluconate dehydrogenase
MGANMVRRLIGSGHECVVFDRLQQAIDELAADGAKGTAGMQEGWGTLRDANVREDRP